MAKRAPAVPQAILARARQVKVILLDMDGTIIQSNMGSLIAIRKALEEFFTQFALHVPLPEDETILSRIGMPSDEFFRSLLPDGHHDKIPILRDKVTRHEIQSMREGRGWLFPGTADTLTGLQARGYRLALVSNCSMGYFRGVIETYALERFFEATLCLGEIGEGSKIQLVRAILDRFGTPDAAIVGDKRYDIEAGKAHGLLSIGCRYGFGDPGELAEADFIINDIRELLAVFPGANSPSP